MSTRTTAWILIATLVSAVAAQVGPPGPATFHHLLAPVPPEAPPATLSGTGARPGAGVRLMNGVAQPASWNSTGMDHDPTRGIIFVGAQISSPATPNAHLYAVEPMAMTQYTTSNYSYIDTATLDGGGPPGPDIAGPVNGVEVQGNGNVLITDFNGDTFRFDDTIAQIDPGTGGSTATLLSFWYLDSENCPSGCRANTNTDLPQNRLDQVLGITTSGGGPSGPNPVFAGSALSGPRGLYRISLVPGTPGTWSLVSRLTPPTGGAVVDFDYDPDQAAQNGLPNVYWMSSAAMVVEATYHPTTNTFNPNQVFLPITSNATQAFVAADGVAALRGTSNPHQLAAGRATSSTTSPVFTRVNAGTGPVSKHPYNGEALFSLSNPAIPGLWDSLFLDEDLGLWTGADPYARPYATRESLQVVLGSLPDTSQLNLDAVAKAPGAGNDPSPVGELWYSWQSDVVLAGTSVNRTEVARVLANGLIEKLYDRPQLEQALGASLASNNVDAFSFASDGGVLVSLEQTAPTTNPFLAPAIDPRDVIHVPITFAANAGHRWWSAVEVQNVSSSLGHAMGPNVVALSLDPGGRTLSNPNPGGTTRRDVVFIDDRIATTSHLFTTRGQIWKHRESMLGFGSPFVSIDALETAAPGAILPVPSIDAVNVLTGPPGNRVNDLVITVQNLGASSAGLLAVGERLVPGVDLRPLGITHYPLLVSPLAILPLAADHGGTAELRLTIPELQALITLKLQALSILRAALGPPGFFTLF